MQAAERLAQGVLRLAEGDLQRGLLGPLDRLRLAAQRAAEQTPLAAEIVRTAV